MANPNNPCITISTGSCGRAAGADDALDVILKELQKLGLENVSIRQVGCAGLCEMEPMVSVKMPNQDTVTYSKVDTDTAKRIVSQHIGVGKVVADRILEYPIH